ncbi:sigma-54-dependent transcriptional regulator [Noviherbaspirillum aerium]|uniref:sigma-54-dependent transcriptional regulator n=1 Tax=Noviherbaspirillum aerium TaxID=2588497 RepID=UPI00124C23F5|nr:sigma-54 dependent transcriptional regulator [Noviherbaspirillum aerium]
MTAPRILVVDDEADLRELLEITLIKMGLDVDSADCLAAARSRLAQTEYGLVLTDMRLPDGLGIELVREVSALHKNTPIAVITAYGSTDNAVSALKAGAFDYLSKPVALDQLRLMVQSALRIRKTDSQAAGAPMPAPGSASPLVGQSGVMQDLRAQIIRLARSMAPVAITGESGSGKELAARDIHAHSARADKPFIAVNCGAIPEALMEAEFFGYRKGAFTGANDDREGFFQAANGGTLMLDEVADLPLPMQVKLLRAIQERRVRKVGATTEEPVDVRLISATHQNLAECVENGKFRQDLYYRLNVIELRLPPLRERLDDIGLLSDAILARLSGSGTPTVLSPAALEALRGYSFPGNVRELENVLERAMAFANDGVIEVADLALRRTASPPPEAAQAAGRSAAIPSAPAAHASPAPAEAAESVRSAEPAARSSGPVSLVEQLDKVERGIILGALESARFDLPQAAEMLGLSHRQMQYRMQRLSISQPKQ